MRQKLIWKSIHEEEPDDREWCLIRIILSSDGGRSNMFYVLSAAYSKDREGFISLSGGYYTSSFWISIKDVT